MRILFIGGTGNISRECTELLRQQGHDVSILTRGNKHVDKHYEQLIADRKDVDAMKMAVGDRRFDVVINFLGFTPGDLEVDAEVFGASIEQYIFISSATVYAKPNPVPISENAPLGNEFSQYAQHKLAAEQWLESHDIPHTIVRPSHTFCKQWIPNLIASGDYTFADRLIRHSRVFVPDDGQTLWTLTTSRDFAVGLAGLVGNQRALGEAVHITSDEVLTWNQIYNEVARALDVDNMRVEKIPTDFACNACPELTPKLKGDKAHSSVFDNARIKSLVPEFQCRDSFRDAIARSVAWFEEDPVRKIINPGTNQLWDKVVEAWLRR